MKQLTQRKQSGQRGRLALLSVALAAPIVLVAVGGDAYAMSLENGDLSCE